MLYASRNYEGSFINTFDVPRSMFIFSFTGSADPAGPILLRFHRCSGPG
jgi:hypothetical protein